MGQRSNVNEADLCSAKVHQWWLISFNIMQSHNLSKQKVLRHMLIWSLAQTLSGGQQIVSWKKRIPMRRPFMKWGLWSEMNSIQFICWNNAVWVGISWNCMDWEELEIEYTINLTMVTWHLAYPPPPTSGFILCYSVRSPPNTHIIRFIGLQWWTKIPIIYLTLFFFSSQLPYN